MAVKKNNEIASRIREARKKLGITQSELAKAIGTHTNVIWQYENAKRIPTLENGNQIAKVLQIDLNYLLGINHSNEYKHNQLSVDELIIEVRKLFKDKNITQNDKEQFYLVVVKEYLKIKSMKGE